MPRLLRLSMSTSSKLTNPMVSPPPTMAYTSLKLSLTFLNDSRILSPVPSFPCVQMSTDCLAMLYYTPKLEPQPHVVTACGFLIEKLDPCRSSL